MSKTAVFLCPKISAFVNICQRLWALFWYENGCLWELSFHKVV